MEKKDKKLGGSVTVFLSLILLLILSLVMVIIEGARVSTAKVFAERALITSMDSTLGEFYAPLFDEYHILALDTGYGGYASNTNHMITRMEEYMEYTFYPNKYNGGLTPSTELYDININKLTITNWTSLMDHQGKIFIQEAAEYMKYKEIGNIAELLLDKMSLLKEPEKVAIIYEDKNKVEEELVKVDESILELMKHIDGLATGKKGLKVNKNGIVKTKSVFVKKFCTEEVSMESVGINNERIFMALKDQYLNPITLLDEIDNYLLKMEELNHESNKYQEEILLRKNLLLDWSRAILSSISKAINTINKIEKKIGKAEPLISEYEKNLKKEKEHLSSKVYNELVENLQELKKYAPQSKEGYDFVHMREILNHNKLVLQSLQKNLTKGEENLLSGLYKEASEDFTLSKKQLEKYNINELEIDYSTLVISEGQEMDITGEVTSLIKGGITGLVTDADTISTAELPTTTLPSVIQAISGEDYSFNFSKMLSDNGSFFENAEYYDTGDITKKAVDEILEKILFQEYLLEHFYHFPVGDEETDSRKPTALEYELEYLITGKHNDKENLSSIISRILLIRTITDFTAILGNKQKVSEAKAIAAALVGFTGLPILITIMQTALMMTLAFAEALVDTCALLLGKNVPILKKNIVLGYKDIFLLNSVYIKRKANTLPDNSKEISLSYNDYIKVFLLFTNNKDLSYRGMDLVQENIKIRYEDNFLIQNCLYDFQVEAKFLIESRFVKIPYISNYINGSSDDFEFKTNAYYGY